MHEAIQVAAFLALVVLPGLGLVSLLAPRLGTAARVALAVPAGALLLCTVQAVCCAAGVPGAAPWAGWALAAIALAAVATRPRSSAGARDGIGWPLVAAVACAAATWMLAARHAWLLDSLPPGGSGMDDTAYHAACSAQFIDWFPAPDPTAEGYRQQAHFLVHLLVGALSACSGEAPYDLLLRAVPLGLAGTLGFQAATAARMAGLGGGWAAAAAIAAVAGGNAAVAALPWIGVRGTVGTFPLPTPILLWKLPGLALALAYLIPGTMLMDRSRFMERAGATARGWAILASVVCIGMCLAKPVAPVVMLAGLALLNAASLLGRRSLHRETIAFALILATVFAAASLLTYDADAYGYATVENQPLRTALAAFHVDPGRGGAARAALLFGALVLWMPLALACVVAAGRSMRLGTLDATLVVGGGAALAGLALLLGLYTPMSAEFQFALAGKFLADAAGATLLAGAAARAVRDGYRMRAVAAATLAAVVCVPVATKLWIDLRNGNRPPPPDAALTPELVEAMRWLRDGSTPRETILLSNQQGIRGTLSATECIAVSGRQAYLACVRYSPGGYIPIWKGDPPPLQGRIDEARAVFRAEPGAAARLAGRTRVRWAVLDRARGERFDENALRAELGEPAFANARVAIWRIEPPTSIEQEPKRP